MITADNPIPSGKHQVRMAFACDGGGLAEGGDVTLYHDGKPFGTGASSTPSPRSTPRTRPATSVSKPAHRPHPITVPPATSSTGRLIGYRSTSATTAKTNSSNRRTGSRSRWRDNRALRTEDRGVRHPRLRHRPGGSPRHKTKLGLTVNFIPTKRLVRRQAT
jgi:hypothetical protein